MSSVALGFDSASFHLRNEGAEDKEGTGSDSCVGGDFVALTRLTGGEMAHQLSLGAGPLA